MLRTSKNRVYQNHGVYIAESKFVSHEKLIRSCLRRILLYEDFWSFSSVFKEINARWNGELFEIGKEKIQLKCWKMSQIKLEFTKKTDCYKKAKRKRYESIFLSIIRNFVIDL